MSVDLGMEACSRGIQVKFFRASALVNRLAEAKRVGELSSFTTKLSKAELMMFYEWGYVPHKHQYRVIKMGKHIL